MKNNIVPIRRCGHTEAHHSDDRYADRHHCKQVDRINRLIPTAMKVASENLFDLILAGEVDSDDEEETKLALDRLFHREMDRLTAEFRTKGPR